MSQDGEARVLIVRPRYGAPRRFLLGTRMVTIGRAPTADIVLADPIVSSVHARVEPVDGGARHRLVDCHSRNGTRLNHQLLAADHALAIGDRIQIGGTLLTYVSSDTPIDMAETPVGGTVLPAETAAAIAAGETRPDGAPRGSVGAMAVQPAPFGTLVDDDTSTITVAPDDFDVDFLEPKTLAADRAGDIALERRLIALYRASKTLTPLADRSPVEARLLKLGLDVIGAMRATVVRIRTPDARPELVAVDARPPAELFDRVPPEPVLIRESRRTGRALLYRRPLSRAGQKGSIASAIVVPLAVEGEEGLLLYADVFDPWAALNADDLRLLGILARHGAVCIANHHLQRGLLELNGDLEGRVASRTRELVESRMRIEVLANVVRHSADAIFTIDETGKVTSWNRGAEEVFGVRAAEVEGRQVAQTILAVEDRERFDTLLKRVRADGSVIGADAVFRRKDGRRLDAQVTLTEIRSEVPDGPHEVSAIVRDVTHSRRLEAEVLSSAKLAAVGTLASGIAHEINNVLAVIMGNAELIQQVVSLPPEGEEHIETILDAARRSKEIVRHLLTFARRRTAKREPVNFVELLESTLRLLATDLTRAGVRVRRSLAAIPPLEGEPGQLSLVILNLVKNARDALAAKGGGELHAVLRRELPEKTGGQAYAVLEIEDQGDGMTPEVRRHLFEPFFTTKEPGQGTGLGLSTAYGIVMNHAGRIEVESEPGKGSKFRVFLPLAKAEVDEPPSPDPDSSAVLRAASPELHVLVVDDDAAVRSTVAAMVKRLGHHATIVASGAEALKLIDAARFDVIFADHSMAGMDGLTLRQEVLRRVPDQRFVLITGNADVDELAAKHALPDSSVLRKPFTFRQIAEVIARALPPG